MIQVLMTDALDNETLRIPPPILSRVYQTFSRGLVNFINAKKIVETPFPFPFAQTIALCLLILSCGLPFVATAVVKQPAWAAALTFLPLVFLHGLNNAAAVLEMPFGDDDNDLPMSTFQDGMNRCLLMMIQSESDLLAACKESTAQRSAAMLLKDSEALKRRQDKQRKKMSKHTWQEMLRPAPDFLRSRLSSPSEASENHEVQNHHSAMSGSASW